MSFPEAIKAALTNYVNFSGRALRSEYWFFFLFVIVVHVVLLIVEHVTGIGMLSIIFGLAVLLPGLAVSVRRLHDLDKSGWFVLIGLIPIVGAIIVLVWMCQQGTSGANRFGQVRVVSA